MKQRIAGARLRARLNTSVRAHSKWLTRVVDACGGHALKRACRTYDEAAPLGLGRLPVGSPPERRPESPRHPRLCSFERRTSSSRPWQRHDCGHRPYGTTHTRPPECAWRRAGPPQNFRCGIVAIVGRFAAWKIRHWPVAVILGSRCGCDLNRSDPRTLMTCGVCIGTTTCGLGTGTRSRVWRRRSSGRSTWATRGASMASASGSHTTA